MHEDQLYIAALDRFLGREHAQRVGTAARGPTPGDGIRFENVSFSYPGATTPTISDVSFHLPPASRVSVLGKNGAGKTTLLKLLTGLYRATAGRITLDGLPSRTGS